MLLFLTIMRSAKIVTVSFPVDLLKELMQIAKVERRSVSEVLRESFRRYAAERALDDVRVSARKTVKKKKITPRDLKRIIGRR